MSEPITFTVHVSQDTEEYAGGPYTHVSYAFDAEGFSFFSFLCDGTTGDVLEAQAANVPAFARLDPCYEMAAQHIAASSRAVREPGTSNPCYEMAAQHIAAAANHHWRTRS